MFMDILLICFVDLRYILMHVYVHCIANTLPIVVYLDYPGLFVGTGSLDKYPTL